MSVLSAPPLAELAISLRDKHNISTLVETGTYRGESTSWAAENFRRVITIDISEEFQQQTREGLCKGYLNINYLPGDTRDQLPLVVGSLPGRSLFWLDAHEASGLFGRHTDDCPILDELDTILSAGEGHCVLIDDAACFVPPVPHDPLVWPEISILQNVAQQYGYLFKVGHNVIAMLPPDAADLLETFGDGSYVGSEITCSALIDTDALKRKLHRNLRKIELVCHATAVTSPIVEEPIVVDLPMQITELLDTAYGRVLVPKYDLNQTRALRQGYSLDHETIRKLISMLQPGAVFLDIGANVGCFSWGLAAYCSRIHMYEPQRIIYNMICGTVAINGWQHIWCHNMAVSDELNQIEVPQFDYTRHCNFGSIEFGYSDQKERLNQERQHDPSKVEYVQSVPIDFFKYPQIDLMKIDVEGMEFKVLRGAKETIERCRPIILIEHGKVHGSSLARRLDQGMNYAIEDNGNDFLCTPRS